MWSEFCFKLFCNQISDCLHLYRNSGMLTIITHSSSLQPLETTNERFVSMHLLFCIFHNKMNQTLWLLGLAFSSWSFLSEYLESSHALILLRFALLSKSPSWAIAVSLCIYNMWDTYCVFVTLFITLSLSLLHHNAGCLAICIPSSTQGWLVHVPVTGVYWPLALFRSLRKQPQPWEARLETLRVLKCNLGTATQSIAVRKT